MKKILITLIGFTLLSCKVTTNKTKHYNARNLTDTGCIEQPILPDIDSIKTVEGIKVDSLYADGVYIVYLSNGSKIKVVN